MEIRIAGLPSGLPGVSEALKAAQLPCGAKTVFS
jgi:hypothetical protein